MEKILRNTLRNVVTQGRKHLEEAVGELLQGQFGIHADGRVEDAIRLTHLSAEDLRYREEVLAHLDHTRASGLKPRDSVTQLIREVAFTHLNRLCAYKMMTSRRLIDDPVGKGLKSRGFLLYLGKHPADEALYTGAEQDVAYRHYFEWLNEDLSSEIGVLFAREDLATRLFPPYRVLVKVLDLINSEELASIWVEDETIGWVYQFFTPRELRDQARRNSSAPRNSYELAFRNQFYTPRYVVEFLADNTLGRIWYEMRKGDTTLAEKCRYMVRRSNEVFLSLDEEPQLDAAKGASDASQEERLDQSVYIKHRVKKDPREIKILDPACGSGHFLLYCFGLLEVIYEEAYQDDGPGPALRRDYATLEDLKREIPRLIIENNLHGIDIDLRSTQISALALWLRCKRAYKESGLENGAHPQIRKTNIVCAEPMPGERELLDEFVKEVYPPFLADVVRVVFERMKLAGEAGTLLRIEEEISGAISEARKHWRAIPQPQQLALFHKEKLSDGKQGLFDLSGITDEQFWHEAEARVLESLQEYAQRVVPNGHGLRRRLFAHDAAQGFAFVDTCRRRFDVVLMNPPFGEAVESSQEVLAVAYPTWNKNLLCAFVERGLELLTSTGTLGAIFDRTAAVKSTYEDFRTSVMLPRDRPTACADLGWEVLDANVETTSVTWQQRSQAAGDRCIFFDVRKVPPEDKGEVLLAKIEGQDSPDRSIVAIASTELLHLPNAVMGYDMPLFLIRATSKYQSLRNSGLQSYTGAQIRSEQHFRVFWECSSDNEFKPDADFCYMYNGGEYLRFFMPPRDVAFYGEGGKNVDESDPSYSWRVQGRHAYFKTGIGFGVRGEFLDAHYLRNGYIFTVEGQNAPSTNEQRKWFALGLLNSAAYQVALNSYCGQHKYSGYVNLLPLPTDGSSKDTKVVGEAARRSFDLLEEWHRYDQTTLIFCGVPYLLRGGCNTNLADQVTQYLASGNELRRELVDLYCHLNASVESILRITPEELAAVEDVNLKLQESNVDTLDGQECIADFLSYALGIVFGYWDMSLVTDSSCAAVLPETPSSYPGKPPAALVRTAATTRKNVETGATASGSPIEIEWDGILVDDPGHANDIVTRTHRVLDLVWGDRAEAIEHEMCELLGVKDLRAYFRKPSSGGFWMDHVKRYSKSRRKAPIYWLLQSSKKSYALWLYYHRLDKDILYKTLFNYVEPKMRLEESNLDQLGRQREMVGTAGREAKQVEKQLEKQESLLSELHDFHDKLKRVADLRLEPDLNDGVVLNIAPLWELVPWSEAKKSWNELLEGKYQWSSISQQLRQLRLVKS